MDPNNSVIKRLWCNVIKNTNIGKGSNSNLPKQTVKGNSTYPSKVNQRHGHICLHITVGYSQVNGKNLRRTSFL